MVRAAKATVACLQETKLQVIDESMVSATLGPELKNNFSFLPADGTRGGVLIAVSYDHFKLLSSSRSKYSISVRIQALQDASEWTLTSVYGPQQEADKIIFLEEIRAMRLAIHGDWLLCRDFNLIYKAEDKSNNRLNGRLMGHFKAVLDELELKELPLHGRRFTWTNGHDEGLRCVHNSGLLWAKVEFRWPSVHF
jgi:hypothetical protein